jgi:hypothetical protein
LRYSDTPNTKPLIALETKSIFSVVREGDSVFAHATQSYDGKDELKDVAVSYEPAREAAVVITAWNKREDIVVFVAAVEDAEVVQGTLGVPITELFDESGLFLLGHGGLLWGEGG